MSSRSTVVQSFKSDACLIAATLLLAIRRKNLREINASGVDLDAAGTNLGQQPAAVRDNSPGGQAKVSVPE